MICKGAEILIHTLKEQGWIPSLAILEVVLPIYDVLYDADIRHILTRHEQGAAHAADGYARASGKTGVCIATSGPGATNLVTGIATANMDSVPMVFFTGQVASHLIGRDAFQGGRHNPASPCPSPSTTTWWSALRMWSGW